MDKRTGVAGREHGGGENPGLFAGLQITWGMIGGKDNCTVALLLAQLGLYLIPLCWPFTNGKCACPRKHEKKDIGKAPLTPKGYLDATRDESIIREWWTRFPDANIGVALDASGLMAIDCDSQEAIQEAISLGLSEEPLTRISRWPAYLYLRTPDTPVVNSIRWGESGKIDILASGYIVAHGKHQTGKEIHIEEGQLSDAPGWAIDVLNEKVRDVPKTAEHDPDGPPVQLSALGQDYWYGRKVVDKADGKVKEFTAEIDVDRSETLFRLAVELAKANASHTGIADSLAQRDTALGYDKFSVRKDDREYQRIADKVFQSRSTGSSDIDTSGIRLTRLSDVQPQSVDWLWEAYMPMGKITILAGDPGLGKSWSTLDIVARLTVGAEPPDGVRPMRRGTAVLLTAEDGLADTVRPRIDTQGGDSERVFVLETVLDKSGDERIPTLVDDIPRIEEVVTSKGADLVVIDPLNAFLGRTNSHVDAEVRRELTPLAKMAERTGAAVLVVMHLNKGDARPLLYRVQGTLGYVAAARSLLMIARHKDEPETRVMALAKSNLAGNMPCLGFTINEDSVLTWTGPIDVDISELLAGTDTNRIGKLADAQEFIRVIHGYG